MGDLQSVWPAEVGESIGRSSSMGHLLTHQQEAKQEDFKAFATLNVEPFAEQWDRAQRIPDAVIALLGKSGYLGCTLPAHYGGQGWDTVTFGLLNEALGRGS